VSSKRYWSQLDGVRAIAIAGVIAYHLGDLPGGWVGVDVFFVLSGYLITSILLTQDDHLPDLVRFWSRRIRRLLPAVMALLVVLSVYAWLRGPGVVPAQLRSPALATLFYVANWQQIIAGHGYFAQFTAVSPLQQTWSLAIEEQYYLFWPLLLGVLLLAARSERYRFHRRALVVSTLLLAALSAVWMGVAAHLLGSNRAYLGTDTRAWELLLGGAAAMLWPPGATSRRPRLWSLLGAFGLLGVVLGACSAGGPPEWIWDGGLVLIACSAALMIVGSVRSPASPLARLLSIRVVCWIGVISYSLYLWHWPVIVLMNQSTTGLSGSSLLAVRLVTMLAASCASYYLIEHPLRRADWAGLARRLRVPTPTFALVGIALTATVIVLGTVGPPEVRSAHVSIDALPSPTPAVEHAHLDVPPATSANPYRVWIFGDSVMSDGSDGVTAALEATGRATVVMNSSFGGWGLTTDTGFPADTESSIVEAHVQIAMGTWSWDNEEALADPAAYLHRLESAMEGLYSYGVQLIVLFEFPQIGPDTSLTDPIQREEDWVAKTAAEDAWDAAARQAVRAFPGRALYLPTDRLFAPDGRFYTWYKAPSGSWVRARKLDNTHFCPYGAAEFGALVVNDLATPLGLPTPAAGWELGSWTSDPRYNDPPGACPDDQPPGHYQGVKVP
jgi:peptidoglycan/LPS O-acetylase OafA/YrhL